MLYRCHVLLVTVSLALAPLPLFALSYAHGVATLVISIWLVLTLTSATLSWFSGYRPARFFAQGAVM